MHFMALQSDLVNFVICHIEVRWYLRRFYIVAIPSDFELYDTEIVGGILLNEYRFTCLDGDENDNGNKLIQLVCLFFFDLTKKMESAFFKVQRTTLCQIQFVTVTNSKN